MVGAGAKTVLVVEDDALQREGLVAVLRRHGHTVVPASDAEQALVTFRAGPAPDLILLDMLLPRRDGWWFLHQLRRDPLLARVPLVITTGLAVASDEWAASLGASGLLRKPFEVEALLDLVDRV
jgi:CheY-like chemotaxis protein